MNEELDSQLSAMFDDELPPAQCELLARRLSRDEGLKARWGRYAVISAVVRAEGPLTTLPLVAQRPPAAAALGAPVLNASASAASLANASYVTPSTPAVR